MKPVSPVPLTLALLALGAPAVAGCGSGGGKSPSTTTPAPSRAASGVQVAMKGIKFQPGVVDAKVGQAVRWVNQDSVPHNVTATSGARFRSSDLGSGGSFTFRPTRAGTIQYTCTIHPGMNGEVVVTR